VRATPRRRGRLAAIGLLGAALVVAGCGAPTGRELRSDAPADAPEPSTVPGAVDALNAFSLDLARAMPTGEGNVAVATYPLARSLAMARLGARGETLAAFDAALHTADGSDLDRGIATIDAELEDRTGEQRSPTRKGDLSLALPSSLWTQEDTVVAPALLDDLARSYATGVRVVDFRSEPDEARNALNRWAAAETQGSVDLLVSRGEVTDFTRLVAASAGAIRAPWAVRFEPDETEQHPFTRADGTAVTVTTMTVRDRGAIRSARGDGWTAVDLPYLGGDLSMLVVVPDREAFAETATRFDGEQLQRVSDALVPKPIELRLPRFEFASVLNLDVELGSLGLTDAFSNERADFSGITADEVLRLSDVVHGTYVVADEEGSDGEAVTVVPSTPAANPDAVVVDVDRPFLFFVRDTATGLILQVGRVLEPQDR
jgi:serpin B